MEEHVKDPAVFLIEYDDGLKAATLMLSGYVQEFAYAARVDGQVHGVEFFPTKRRSLRPFFLPMSEHPALFRQRKGALPARAHAADHGDY